MSDENLQEWEEYDARLLDDAPIAPGTRSTQRTQREFSETSSETYGDSESPFLLENVGEIAAELEGMALESDARKSARALPEFGTEEAELPVATGQNRIDPRYWFLPAGEMGRRTPAFTEGNEVLALIDGAQYMSDLLDALKGCDRGVFLSGWRVTGQQPLNPTNPPTNAVINVITAILNTIPRGARVRAMIYKVLGVGAPGAIRAWHAEDNRLFCEAVRTAGQEAVLDGRLSPKPMSSHHQKFVLVESSNPAQTRAYVGGIDLCFDRWDTPAHTSPPERQRDIIEFYLQNAAKLFRVKIPQWILDLRANRGLISSYLPSQPGWHDVQARVRGPAMQQIWSAFFDRWNDSRPANSDSGLGNFQRVTPISASPPELPGFSPGTCWVQVLETLPCKGTFGPFPFAPGGEQTIEKAYRKAIDKAEKFIYIEEQYLWPSTLVNRLAAALQRNVHVVILVARDYDLPGMSAVHCSMRAEVVNKLRSANPTRFKIFHLQQPTGGQIYVHAKTMIVDDTIAFIGSANLNHRSMTNDTELQIGILDSVAVNASMNDKPFQVSRFAHEYRCRLWQEHLKVRPDQVEDPITAISTLWATAPSPGGRVFPHKVAVPGLDVSYVAEFIANLIADIGTPPIPGLPQLVPAGRPVAKKAIELALRGASKAVSISVINWLADVLNPNLPCADGGTAPRREVPEFETQMQAEALHGAERQESLVDETDGKAWRANSLEFDPYAAIRSAMSPEHANLAANEVTTILGRMPSTLVLNQLLNSPEMRQATLASLLGKAARRSVRVNGLDISIPAYFRLVSRLCGEVAELSEAEFKRPLTSRNDIADQAFDTASASVSEAEVGETDDGSSRDLEEASYITADAFVVDKDGQEYFTTFPQLGDLTVQKATILTPSNFESLMDHLLASNQKNFLIDAHGDPSGLSMHLASGTKISATKQSLFILRGIEQIQTLMRLAHESNTIWGRASGTELDRWRRIVKTLHSKTWQKMVGLTRPTETPQVSNVDAARSIVQSRLAALVDALFLGEIANKQERVDRLIKKMLQLQARGIREIQFRACNIGKDPVTLYEFRKFFGADHLCAPDVRSGMGLVVPRIDRGAVDRLAKGRLTQLYNLPGGRFAIWIKISGAKFTAACAADTQEAVGEWVESHVMANSTYRKGTLPIHFLQTQPLVFALDKDYAAHIQCRSSLWEGAVRANELEEEEAHKDEEYEPDRSIGGDQETQTQREETFAFDSREGSDEIETEDESEVEQAWASTLEQEGAAQEQEAEDYEPPAAEWPPGIGGEQTEDFTGVDYEEGESQVLDEQPLEERFDPTAVPKDVANALCKQDWALALKLTIQAGWRDENDLTNLIFFARHPELPTEPLKRDDPNFKQLSAEWAKILDKEVWKATKVSAENSDLVVSGEEVTDHHRSFFRGKSGKRLKKLVEDAAKEVDLNPGLLGTIMMAETRRPLSYLSSEKVSSYHIGCDDFYEARAAINARVPAYVKVKWDRKQTPVEHLNDAKTNPRLVKTILFDSGPDAALATAVYVKFREVRLREIAAELGKDFDSLPLPTRFALTRMAMAAGTGGATPYLKDALNGVDIFVREAIPVREYQTKRNATVRTAQAMHLSDWIFGIPVEPATRPAAHESETWDEEQEDLYDLDSSLEEERGDDEGEADTYEVHLEENEFRVDRLPQKARAQFSKTDSAAWRNAVDEAIGAGVKDPKDLADLIFFMQHRDRVVSGVGKPINPRDPEFFKLRAEWNLYHTIASRRLNPSAPCSVFLPANPSNDYEKYVAKATTGRMTLMINGRTSGTNKTEAFDGMQQTVESLEPNDTVYLAAFQVNPTELTGPKPTGVTTWADLFVSKAHQGVKIRIIMTDIPEFGPTDWKSNLNDLNAAIGRLPDSARDNLKYVVSMHPAQLQFQVVSLTNKIVKVVPRGGFLAHVATHHQKFMVVRKSGKTIAYCGGLDISPQRTPQGWPDNKLQPANRLVWHDTHVKLEGLIARDLEREFVLRWNREKDKSTAAKLRDWKPFENLNQVPLGSADREATKNTHKLQMLRTVSAGATTPDIRRDDVWQGYFRLIGCATRFLFMENQYFHEPTMADAIVKQAEAQSDLIIIIVVAFQIDDPTNQLTEHGRAQQNEFFKRLSDRIPQERLRVYTMFGRLVHSKLILVDDQALSVGSTNADPRDFFMDTQLNVILDDPRAVKGFRHQLWSHDLGVTEAKVAGWGVSDFIAQWDLVANANNGLRTTPERMTGEAVVPFDPSKVKGKLSAIPDILSEVDGGQPGEDTHSI